MTAKFWMGLAAFVLPTFPLGYTWHLTTFAESYAALGMLRADPVIPFGLASMIIQGALFSWAYPRLFDTARDRWLGSGLKAAGGFGLLAWTFAVLAVAAKYRSASTLGFLQLETAFTALQFLVVCPLIALVHRDQAGSGPTQTG